MCPSPRRSAARSNKMWSWWEQRASAKTWTGIHRGESCVSQCVEDGLLRYKRKPWKYYWKTQSCWEWATVLLQKLPAPSLCFPWERRHLYHVCMFLCPLASSLLANGKPVLNISIKSVRRKHLSACSFLAGLTHWRSEQLPVEPNNSLAFLNLEVLPYSLWLSPEGSGNLANDFFSKSLSLPYFNMPCVSCQADTK